MGRKLSVSHAVRAESNFYFLADNVLLHDDDDDDNDDIIINIAAGLCRLRGGRCERERERECGRDAVPTCWCLVVLGRHQT